MRYLNCLICFMGLMLSACSDESHQTPADNTEQTDTAAATKPVDYFVIKEGNTSGIQEGVSSIFLIDSPGTLQKFWNDHNQYVDPKPAMPDINFDKNMIIAIVDSEQPSSGYQLAIDALQIVDDKLYISVSRSQPGPGCVNLGMISQPYTIIEVPKMDVIPELRLSTKTIPCE